jgi:hypothetical protein
VADVWEQGLVTGNGRMGAALWGTAGQEVLTISLERLFLPLWEAVPPVPTVEILASLRQKLWGGDCQGAANDVMALARQTGLGDKRWTDPRVPAFEVVISEAHEGLVSGYQRWEDMRTGEIGTAWRSRGGTTRHRTFVSRAHGVCALEIVTSQPTTYRVWVRRAFASDDGREQAVAEAGAYPERTDSDAGRLRYLTRFRHQWPGAARGVVGALRAVADVDATEDGGALLWAGATRILVLIGARVITEDDAGDPERSVCREVDAVTADYDRLLAGHVPLRARWMGEVDFRLGGAAGGARGQEGTAVEPHADFALLERQFYAGRARIADSCGELPPTLQGVWGGTWTPPWSDDYTLNANVQMALAAVLPSGPPQMLLPLFDFLEAHMDEFRENAKALYGCRGIYVPSRMSTHGFQNHFDPEWPMTFWTAGAGWCARFYYDYWQYTGDREFLAERAFPFMQEAGRFWEDFMVTDDAGALHFCPSYSPENAPRNTGAQACCDATMDVAVAKDLYRNLVTCGELLGVDGDLLNKWAGFVARLPRYRVNDEGALAEWIDPRFEDNYEHRHSSHLYPVMYEVDPEISGDERLWEAAREAVRRRLRWQRSRSRGGESAFGLCQLGIAAAHLGMADEAEQALLMVSTRFWRPALTTTHEPGEIFNVDACGGLPALMLAMVVQSEKGKVKLLPALPARWRRGSLSGARGRGSITFEHIEWDEVGFEARLSARTAGVVRVGLPPGAVGAHVEGAEVRHSSGPVPGEVCVLLREDAPLRVSGQWA